MLKYFLLLSTMFLAPSIAQGGPLHDAAAVGDIAAVQAALDGGADPNERAENGETPLTTAILNAQTAAVALMLKRGANVDARNKGGFTPLHAAAYVGAQDIAKVLVERGASIDDRKNEAAATPLIIAAEENRIAVARFLVSKGAKIELTEQNGYTSLTRAIWRDHKMMISFLQGAGAKCQAVEILEEPAYSACIAGQKK